MTIITRQRSDKFAIIPNAVAEDNRLSFAARGLLVYLLAKPNNWQVKISDIRSSGGIGRDLAYKLLDELKVAGYIEIEKKRTAPGTFASHNYVVYDNAVPGNLPLPENAEVAAPRTEYPDVVDPVPCLPDTDEPYPVNTDAIVRTQDNNTHFPLPPLAEASRGFNDLWSAWNRDDLPDRQDTAKKLFVALSPEEQRWAVKYAPEYRRFQIFRGKSAHMIPYLRTKVFLELNDAPPFDKDGDYIITPDRPEWEPWIIAARTVYGEDAVIAATSQGRMLRKKRWPDGHSPPAR